jgi:hypothetical protein
MHLDSYLPNYFAREVNYAAVKTPPAETYRAICDFDMANIPWIRHLFQLRTVFERSAEKFSHLTLRDSYKTGAFVLLKEAPDQELVVGAIGKIWRRVISFKTPGPNEFSSFHKSGFGKVAWSLRCDPRLQGGTLVSLEVRVGATDLISSLKMRGYFSVIGAFSRAIRRAVFRRISEQLGGVFAEEESRTLPGDSIIDAPLDVLTHGLTIEAPVETIWPWLLQMGCRRAGWYSYDWLDNGGTPSAQRIVSEWQHSKAGDLLPATPSGEEGFYVVDLDEPRFLLLGGYFDQNSGKAYLPNIEQLPGHYIRTTWAFVLEPQTPEITRLIVRVRADFTGLAPVRKILMRKIHNFMEEKQMKNIKQRAEQMHLRSA